MSSVMEYLQGRGVPFLVLPAPQATEAVEAARAHGFSADEVVRTAVVTTRYGHALMVIPAGRELVEDLVVAALGDDQIRLAGERDILRTYPDYEPGALPPLGLFFAAPMYVDTAVARREAVVFAVGRASLAIRMLTKDLFRDDPVVIVPLTWESVRESAEEAQSSPVDAPADGPAE